MNRVLPRLVAVLSLGFACATARAADVTKADKELLAKVSQRLLAVCEPVPGYQWPPDVGIDGEGVNAYATLIAGDGKPQPIVRVSPDLLHNVIQGDPDRLSFVVGHELGHILRKHVSAHKGQDRGAFVRDLYTRSQELEADQVGAEMLLKAGYSLRKAVRAITRMKELGLDYSSFEGLGKDHPSWDDRMTRIDKEKSDLWRAMSAFDNGVVFLATEQYPAAEQCFDRVTKEFPGCYEAWVNLGFACLMEYCDRLDTQDLRDYGIGQILTGGFYRRADSITLRGRDPKLWWKAIGALREAIRLKDDLTLAKANLGLAYLVHPDGKDVGEAAHWLQEAATAAATDRTLDRMAHASLLVNLGVAHLAAGQTERGLAELNRGEQVGRALAGGRSNFAENSSLTAALLYNRALQLEAKKDRDSRAEACDLFAKYLKSTNPLSLWWPIAYDHYEALAQGLERTPKGREAFKKDRPPPVRLVTGVKLKSGAEVMLGDEMTAVTAKLGPGEETVAASGTNLKRLHYPKEGVELLVTDVVLAICLTGAEAPTLPLRGRGVGAEQAGELKVGMSGKDVEALLGEDYQPCELTVSEVYYRFYREQGVALRVKKGTVAEVVIVQIPSR